MSYETLLFDVADGVARITLNRPDAANGLDMQMSKDLLDVAMRCDEDPAIRAVLLTGQGAMFCAGGDVKGFAASGDDFPRLVKEMTSYLHAAIAKFARMDAPVVIAVNGMAAGAGFSLAAFGDIVLCAASARFTMAYTGVGLSPDGSSTFFLPRIIGTRRTTELMLTNRVLSADEALSWSLVTQVLPDDALMEEADKLARRLAQGPTKSYGSVKRLLQTSLQEGLETQMEYESRAIADCARTEDGREGVNAFVEKRKPVFKGR